MKVEFSYGCSNAIREPLTYQYKQNGAQESPNLAGSNSDTRMSIMRIKLRARMDAGFSKTL